MIGPYIAAPGVPCCSCKKKIAVGAPVFYVGPRLEDSGRTCSDCAKAAA